MYKRKKSTDRPARAKPPVSFGCANLSKANARISSCRFYDPLTGLLSGRFGRLHYTERQPVLSRNLEG
jgi:hypothetical protein